jgi:hypothetical protein
MILGVGIPHRPNFKSARRSWRSAIKDEIDLINTHHDQQTNTNKVAQRVTI